jgi:amino acid adenylation domain-containing protein
LKNIFARIAGITVDQVEVDVTLLELGVDSLTMIQATQTIQTALGVKIPFRVLIEDNPTLTGLAAYVASQMPAEEPQVAVAVEESTLPARGVVNMSAEQHSGNGHKEAPSQDTPLARIIAQQLAIMAEQLEILRGGRANGKEISTVVEASVSSIRDVPTTVPAPAAREIAAPVLSEMATEVAAAGTPQNEAPATSEAYVPFKPARPASVGGLSARQQEHLDQLIERFCKRTSKSKEQAYERRSILADSRTSAGFRLLWKEMLYTLCAERADGARIWDVDGNEYVDIAMGYGALLFGHTPPSFEGLRNHFDDGIRMGLISNSVREAAELVRDLTGVERVTFCNSGTEAVMIALRLARTVTGRSKIAFFEGSYHGFFDEVLVRPSISADGGTCMAPIAPGITAGSAGDVLVLEYGDPKSLEVLAKHANELAAVLVEPVQSRRPDLQPIEFLRKLRELTHNSGTALIFDEVITGFRVHPRGVQGLFDIEADIVTYGKGVGAGVPVAIVAGKSNYIDAIDGGQWSYGDKSFPRAERTYVAGTYFMHPVTMTAVSSALEHLKKSGPQLQEQLNAKTREFVRTLNAHFETEKIPIHLVHFGSLFRFVFSDAVKFADLFFYHLLEKGVYTWEGRNCFLSTAHTDEDIDRIMSAVKESAAEMRAGGFIPTPEPAAEPRQLPTTIAQKELWLLTRMGDEASRAYNESVTMHLRGPFDLPAMRRAISKLIARHEALRITLSNDGEYQRIAPNIPLDLPLTDFTNENPTTRESMVAEWLATQAHRVFDLERGPLVHFGLAKLEDKYHLLVLTLHHIVTDGWSNGVLLHDIGVLYTAECQGKENPLPPVLGYSEYVELQLREQQSPEMQAAQEYWLDQFSAAVSPLELPADRRRPPLQTYAGARQRSVLDSSLLKQLRTASAKQGSTLFVTLLAAFQLLLHRLSGQDDLVVGISAAGQPHAGDNGLVGYCTNLLSLRSRLTGNPSFKTYVASVKKTVFDAYEHQIYPFGKLIRELKLQRDPSRPPLVSVIFNMDTKLDETAAIPDLDVTVTSNLPPVAKFDLTLNVSQVPGELLLDLEYNTDLFDAQTIERWQQHFRTLLESIVADGDKSVLTLPLLTAGEVSSPIKKKSEHALIHQLFAGQAGRTPTAVALVHEDQRLTYAELDEQSNQLAHYLRSVGVGAETLVGLCMDRSIQMVVALLGVLKAGGAYLPLDPSYPRERLAFMLADAQAPLLLTQDALLHALPKYDGKVVCLDLDWDLIARFPIEAPEGHIDSDNLAYIVYTSGSTGQPKGVMVTHANVTRLFTATDHWFHFNERDVWTFFHSYAFDFSVWELWGALLYGGRLVVVPYWVSRSPEAFYEILRGEKVTVLNQTPSAFRQLIQTEETRTGVDDLALRLVIFGGEALDLQMLQPWIDRHGVTRPQLVNMYGISETTVHVTYRLLTENDIRTDNGSMIGGPIPDLSLHLLDPYLQPIPVGVTGEMFVGGEGVARGYLNRPRLTAERFIPDPFSAEPGARLYRSGDVARTLPNGDVEYLGRMDHQVKVRGFRIELGEIESVLRRHPAIREALVSMCEDNAGEKRLVAYLIGEEAAHDSLRGYLKENLPEYMIPSATVWLEAFPLTASGKIDRKALPVPGNARPELHELYVPPRTPTEELMSAIWSKALGVYPVGIHDNFFALGGDSIRGIQVLGGARARGLQHFQLPDLFRYPTINELSQALAQKSLARSPEFHTQPFSLISAADHDKLPPEIEDAYPLTMLQSGMLYHMTLTPEASVYHNVNSLRVKGPFDVEAMQQATQHIVNRQPVLRTSFDFGRYSEPLQLVHRSAHLPVEAEDLRGLSDERQLEVIDEYVESELRNYFDPAKPPLIRIKLHRLKDDEFQWTLTDFHPVIDGWAVAVMITEISAGYATLLNGGKLGGHEPPLSVTFRDYVNRELSILKDEGVRKYLTQMLEGNTLARLPRWPIPSQLKPELEIQSLVFEVPDEILAGLQQLVRSEAIPLQYLLLTAHVKVINLLTGQNDISAGLVVDGRLEEPGGEQVLGLYLNTMPFRLQLSRGTWIELAQEVFAAVLSLLPQRRFPLAALQHEFGGSPLFENMFYFIDFHNLHAMSRVSPLKLVEGTHSFNYTHFPLQATFSLDRAAASDENALKLQLDFDASQFHPQQIETINAYYREALRRLVTDPFSRHETESLLSIDEQRTMLVEWNETTNADLELTTIPELFDAQADLTPNAVALVCEDQELSYRQLKSRANQLANYLKDAGVGAESIVGISMDRSIDAIVALLGVLKAGGAYLPLDPSYPRERLAFMIADAQPVLVLTQDTDWNQIAAFSEELPRIETSADNLCYVIYTSGSTGQPKGVLNTHRGAVNRFRWMWEQHPFVDGEVCCQKTSLNFVDSVWEIFGPLLQGISSVVIPEEIAKDPLRLVETLSRRNVTRITLVPSLLRMVLALEVDLQNKLPRLKHWTTSGEALSGELVEAFRQRLPHALLLNLYGSSEVAADVTHCEVLRENDFTKVPIGRPIANTQIYLLDPDLQPVPVGATGELYVGGAGLSRGYHKRPGMTAEKFIPSPFGPAKGARLYRSGDLARYRPDGAIEYLGRTDHQVKLRGFRIELGEVETVLNDHEAVKEAVVLVREDSVDPRLVAYVVTNEPGADVSNQLRSYVKTKLPEYMAPSVFVHLDALPVTGSGKVDRRALPAPDQSRPALEEQFVAPRNPIEESMAQIWREILELERVGVHDNFFDLGGNSLSAMQIIAKVTNTFEVDLPLFTLFDTPTIAALSEQIELAGHTGPDLQEKK